VTQLLFKLGMYGNAAKSLSPFIKRFNCCMRELLLTIWFLGPGVPIWLGHDLGVRDMKKVEDHCFIKCLASVAAVIIMADYVGHYVLLL